MKLFLTGASGQLGREIMIQCKQQGYEILGRSRREVDIVDEEKLQAEIQNYHPDIVINCAAYNAVDKSEDEGYEEAIKVNVRGVDTLAKVCGSMDVPLVHFSTDYVFDGKCRKPINESEPPNPINKYGLTKLLGEQAIQDRCQKFYIIRTAWLYGNGDNFVNTMLNLSENTSELSVVYDQVGSPTYTVDLAAVVLKLVQTEKYGIYHATNEGFCSWHEFACEIFRIMGLDIKVNGVSSQEYGSRAQRPEYSVLENAKLKELGLNDFRHWKVALADYLRKLKNGKQVEEQP